jgi:sigma-B regulation protein RsbU (phosphoserine phosphatase)
MIEVPGPWLGIDPTIANIPAVPIALEPDDILCLYTDGLPEARNQAGELFDIPRFVDLVAETARQQTNLDAIADEIIRRVQEHTAAQEDDWTLLLVKRRAMAAVC